MELFFFKPWFTYDRYRLDAPKGNFNLKITADQLIYRFSDDISKVFPEFASLPHKFKLNFTKRILKFLKQYAFISQENVQLTNVHKIAIATSYLKLTLGYRKYLINTFDSIIIYPTAHYFPHLDEIHSGHFNPKTKTIMLALDEFEMDVSRQSDGKDVSLHEFTHALCFEMLQRFASHPDADCFKKHYYLIHDWLNVPQFQLRIKESNFLRSYAFSDRLEMISVLIELFFEREVEFRTQFPDLYLLVGSMIKHPKVKKTNF